MLAAGIQGRYEYTLYPEILLKVNLATEAQGTLHRHGACRISPGRIAYSDEGVWRMHLHQPYGTVPYGTLSVFSFKSILYGTNTLPLD